MYSKNPSTNFTREGHGDIELEWSGNLLLIKASGPYNMEGIRIAVNTLMNSVKKQKFSSWLRLEIGDENAFGNPDVMQEIAQSYVWGFENGCKATAFVYNSSIQKMLCEDLMKKHSFNFQAFSSIEDARHWLQQQ